VEHAILHLIYSRFWTKFMRDIGLVRNDEPVMRLFTQGMVIKGGAKMSKNKGNVVSPDDMVARFGADSTRVYTLFAAPPDRDLDWQDAGVEGVHRFLSRVYRLTKRHGRHFSGDWKTLLLKQEEPPGPGRKIQRKLHQTIRRITLDFDGRWHFNTSIAAIMELVNELYFLFEGEYSTPDKDGGKLKGAGVAFSEEIKQGVLRCLVLLLAPFAPYIAAELWEALGEKDNLLRHPWPDYDPALAREDEIEYPIQINGKLRSKITVPADSTEDFVRERGLADEKVRAALETHDLVNVIAIRGRLVNVVIKPKKNL